MYVGTYVHTYTLHSSTYLYTDSILSCVLTLGFILNVYNTLFWKNVLFNVFEIIIKSITVQKSLKESSDVFQVQKEYRKFARRTTWLPQCIRVNYGGYNGNLSSPNQSTGSAQGVSTDLLLCIDQGLQSTTIFRTKDRMKYIILD